jgi:HAD superfamily hydrolase (TIGR01484 family)
MFKLVALDIDGTILVEGEKSLSPKIIELLARLKAKNIVTAFCTGRDFITIGTMLETPNVDYFIGANGTFVYDLKNKKMLYEDAIKYKNYKILEDFCHKNNINISVVSRNSVFFDDKSKMEDN